MDVHAGVHETTALNLSGFTLDKVMDDPALREQGAASCCWQMGSLPGCLSRRSPGYSRGTIQRGI